MSLGISDRFAQRLHAVVQWAERQMRSGGTNPRGRTEEADPFERAKLDATLNKGSSALATIMAGNPEDGWSAGTEQITVYEDDMLAAGESIASAKEIHIKWMHGRWVLDDVACADIA